MVTSTRNGWLQEVHNTSEHIVTQMIRTFPIMKRTFETWRLLQVSCDPLSWER